MRVIPLSDYPKDIAQLVERHGGPGAAEKAAGLSKGVFSKITTRKINYTDHLKVKVRAALDKPGDVMTSQKGLPKGCPPLLAELIRLKGTKKAAIELLGTSDGTFYAVLSGAREMSPEWIFKIKAALGQPLLGDQDGEPPAPPIPPFVPWDGTIVTYTMKPKAGVKKGRMVKAPSPLAKLLEKYEGNVSQAARSMGHTSGAIHAILLDPKKKYTEQWQRKVHNALHGAAPQMMQSMGENFDKFTLGIAIVMMGAGSFDRIQEIADILNGHLVFKKNTKGGWLMIYKMGVVDLQKFKRLAMRDANEIVCP